MLMHMYNSSFTQTNVLSHVVRAVALRRDNRCRQGDQVFMENVHAHSAARQGAISRGRVEARVGGEVVFLSWRRTNLGAFSESFSASPNAALESKHVLAARWFELAPHQPRSLQCQS